MKYALLALLLAVPSMVRADNDNNPGDVVKKVLFNAFDTNNDDYLSAAEFQAGMGPIIGTESATEIFAAKDRDGDGKLTFTEFKITPTTS